MSGKGGIAEAEWMSQQQQQNMSRKRAEVNITVCVTDRPAEEEMNEPRLFFISSVELFQINDSVC